MHGEENVNNINIGLVTHESIEEPVPDRHVIDLILHKKPKFGNRFDAARTDLVIPYIVTMSSRRCGRACTKLETASLDNHLTIRISYILLVATPLFRISLVTPRSGVRGLLPLKLKPMGSEMIIKHTDMASLVEEQKVVVRSLCVGIAFKVHIIESLPTDSLIEGFVRLISSTFNGPIARYVVARALQSCQRLAYLLITR